MEKIPAVTEALPPKETFQDLIKYKQPALEKAKHSVFELTLPKPKISVPSSRELFGIEIEVENCGIPLECDYYWKPKPDNSLRDNGVEFVSIPLRLDQVENALLYLDSKIKKVGNSPRFSNRTSVHIHMDARSFTQDQLWCFVILYSIFEKHFYSFAGKRREGSIFCVPLYKTNYIRNLNEFVFGLSATWSKYCGLNLSPMFANTQTQVYGTVEFRHLYGTLDPEIIIQWMLSIYLLKKTALTWTRENLTKELQEMNTSSGYLYLYKLIFGELCRDLTQQDFESCISHVKKELFREDYQGMIRRDATSLYISTLNSLNLPN